MIKITDVAEKYLSQLLLKQNKGTNIRIFVINPGLITAECAMSYCSSDEISLTDIEVKFKKIFVYIDQVSLPYLKDAEIDFISDNLTSQLTIKAPNIKINKIPGDDASITDRVSYLLQTEINPQLANHEGFVSLIEITKDGYVVLQFSGGCNGCSMVNVTLKENIEKKILETFSELNGVRDLTEHYHGKHSYY